MKNLNRHSKHKLRPTSALAVLTTLTLVSTAATASNCEDISAQIDAKIRAAGVQQFALRTVDVAATTGGKVVGTCDLGGKKIIYLQGLSPADADVGATPSTGRAGAGRQGSDGILTECKDGSVSRGGDCKR